jgi:hypothetical protein
MGNVIHRRTAKYTSEWPVSTTSKKGFAGRVKARPEEACPAFPVAETIMRSATTERIETTVEIGEEIVTLEEIVILVILVGKTGGVLQKGNDAPPLSLAVAILRTRLMQTSRQQNWLTH